MNRQIPIWIALLGALMTLWAGNSASANVRVEEVTLSLYNKPVTGFRVVLDRSQSFVTRKLIEHVAEYEDAKPFQYERTLIYENIRYTPITDEQDISLYFLMRSMEGQFTELTYVAMYDYKRSVSTRQFPRLAQQLLIDLARMVRGITGDVMESADAVYDDATLARLTSDSDTALEESGTDPAVEHFAEEEVENPDVLIRRDPFEQVSEGNAVNTTVSESDDSTVAALKKRVQELEQREKELLNSEKRLRADKERLDQRQETMMGKIKQNKSLRDSIVLLNQRVKDMLGQYYVADDISVSNETAERIFELERIQERNEREIARLRKENDSLSRFAGTMRTQLASLSDSRRSQVERLNELEKENERLSKETADLRERNTTLETAHTATAGLDSILVLLDENRQRNRDLQREMEAESKETARLQEDNDWLTGKKLQLEERIAELESVNRDLHAQLEKTVPGRVIIEESGSADADSLARLLNSARNERNALQGNLQQAQSEQQRLGQQLASLRSERSQLESRIEALEGDLNALRRQDGADSQTSGKALQDSLKLMRIRLDRLQAQEGENARLQKQIDQQQQTLNSRQQQVKQLKASLDSKSQALQQAETRNRSLDKQVKTAKTELATVRKERDQKQNDLETLVDRNQKLEKRLENLRLLSGQSDAKMQTVLDSIDQLQREKSQLQADIGQRDRQIRRQIEQRDSLEQAIANGDNARNDLRRQVDQLEARVDSLSRTSLPVDNQQQFIREQWTRLQEWEKELKSRDKDISDKEKLLDQRQAFLDKQQTDLGSREDRFKDLQEREEALRLREQELNSREGTSGIIVRSDQIALNRINEFGETVSVFVVSTPLRYKLAQKQVVAYMLKRNEILDEQFPDILYRSVMFPELDLQPVEFRVRIGSEGTGSVIKFSFRLADGSYLGEDSPRKVIEKAKQLISNLLRYRSQG